VFPVNAYRRGRNMRTCSLKVPSGDLSLMGLGLYGYKLHEGSTAVIASVALSTSAGSPIAFDEFGLPTMLGSQQLLDHSRRCLIQRS